MKRFVLFIAALFFSAAVFAQETVPANTAFDFLVVPRSAVTSAMAGAGSASTEWNGAFAAFSNPAVLPFMADKAGINLSYSSWAPALPTAKSQNVTGGLALKLGKSFAVNAGVAYQAHSQQDFGQTYGTYAPSDLVFALGAGLGLGDHWSLGVSARYVSQSLLSDYKISGVSVTAMAQFHQDALDVAAGVANLGSGVKSESGNVSSLPGSAHAAAVYSIPVGLGVALDADYFFSGKMGLSAGVNYTLMEKFSARVGYRYASEGAPLPSHLALGLGAKLAGFSLDVAYLTLNQQIGNTISASLGYRF